MKLMKKFAIVLACMMMLFNFGGVKEVKADDVLKGAVGSALVEPAANLLLTIGDAIYNITSASVVDQDVTLITVDTKGTATFWSWVKSHIVIIGLVAAAVIGVAVTVLTAGILSALGVGILSAVLAGTAVAATAINATFIGAVYVYSLTAFNGVIELPIYKLSPEEIFKNDIAMFDVDFFNPKEGEIVEQEVTTTTYAQKSYQLNANGNKIIWYDQNANFIGNANGVESYGTKYVEVSGLYGVIDDSDTNSEDAYEKNDEAVYNAIVRMADGNK